MSDQGGIRGVLTSPKHFGLEGWDPPLGVLRGVQMAFVNGPERGTAQKGWHPGAPGAPQGRTTWPPAERSRAEVRIKKLDNQKNLFFLDREIFPVGVLFFCNAGFS